MILSGTIPPHRHTQTIHDKQDQTIHDKQDQTIHDKRDISRQRKSFGVENCIFDDFVRTFVLNFVTQQVLDKLLLQSVLTVALCC